jgi:hypothetical protein
MLLIAAGCSDHKNNQPVALHHSRAESIIDDLIDSFKSDYTSAPSADARKTVLTKYQVRAEKFLSNHYLNHMHVHIDSVMIKNLTIETKFHSGKNLAFTSSMEFHRHMPPHEDSLYSFMKNLRQGADTNIDFMYIGKFELHPPDDSLKSSLIVNAYPLSYQVHGRR